MRRWILLFAIVFVFSVLCNVGQTQMERTLEDRVGMLEDRIAELEGKFDAVVALEIEKAEADYLRLNRSERKRRQMLEEKKEWIEREKRNRISQNYSRRRSYGRYCY